MITKDRKEGEGGILIIESLLSSPSSFLKLAEDPRSLLSKPPQAIESALLLWGLG